MAEVTTLGLDTFVVINKAILNDQDHLFLTLLYQPIIGSVSVSLYLTLWRYLNQDKISSDIHTHQDLARNMQLKLEDIIESREKLEAIGLMKTYFQKGDSNKYVYELYNPLSSYEFISNPILNTALYNNVTKQEYKRIIDCLTVPKINLKDYKDVSCSLSDVFAFSNNSTIETPNIRKLNHLDLSFEPTISFNDMLALIPNELLNYKSICKDVKEDIYKLSFVYHLDNDAMSEAIINSLVDRKIDMELLKQNCRKIYSFEHNGEIPMIVYRNQPLYLRQNRVENTNKSKLISQFETTHPYEFLQLKQGGTPTTKDLGIIEYLLLEQNLTPGVVNVLIDYVLKINNNKLIKSFVEQIAAQWKRSHIETVSDAIDYAKKEYGGKKVNKARTEKKEEKVPTWFDQNVVEEVATKEEIAELERRLMQK